MWYTLSTTLRIPRQDPPDAADLDTYIPKHKMRFPRQFTHCCFSGCTPKACPGGCCVKEMFSHRPDCPESAWQVFEDIDHEMYVAAGLAKHLKSSA